MVIRIARWGKGMGVRLPSEALEQAGMAVGDAVRVEVEDGRVTLEKARRVRGRYRLEDLIARMPEHSQPEEVQWGRPVGAEEW